MVDRVININCRHLLDVFMLISVTCVTFYTKLQIMTLETIYKNESCSPTSGGKAWLLFSETCPGALETHVFSKLPLVSRL